MIDIKAIEERCERATKGPWHEYENTVSIGYTHGQDVRADNVLSNRVCRDCSLEDMEFIAHSREDLPALLEAVKEARAIFTDMVYTTGADSDTIEPLMKAEAWLANVGGEK
jgi:hypothetical protein